MTDQWMIREPRVEQFVATIRRIFSEQIPIQQRLNKARPAFRELLLSDGWLPEEFAHADANSGMGNGIGTWLIFRAGDDSLGLFSLAVEPNAETPVHDHLRWGLIGIYRGEQVEHVYRKLGSEGAVEQVSEQRLSRGEIYDLLPPDGDIHSVRTISPEPSVSIHLLGGDVGCIWRHRYDVAAGTASPFRSGYSNAPCDQSET